MKKVLMITNSFPPVKKGGRAARLAIRVKYSSKYGWTTVVLKFGQREHSYIYNIGGNRIRVYQVGDPLRRLGSRQREKANQKGEKSVTLSTLMNITQPLFFPDTANRWIIPMAIEGKRIIKKEKVDAMYTMNYPFSLHLAGLILKKTTGVPWLAEFWDPWVKNTNPIHFMRGKAGLLHEIFERKVVELSDKVAFQRNTQMPKEYFYQTYPDIPKNKFHMLPFMGYDAEKFQNLQVEKFEKFTITYGGSTYAESFVLKNFLKGLSRLMKMHNLSSEELQVNFLGGWKKEYSRMVKNLHLDSIVNPHGWVSHNQYLRFLMASDILLLMIRRFGGDELNIPSKVFEYIGAKKPILALVPHHYRAAKLVESEKLGLVVDPNDPKKIAEALSKMYSSSKNNFFSPSAEFLRSLDAENVERQFCTLLDDILLHG